MALELAVAVRHIRLEVVTLTPTRRTTCTTARGLLQASRSSSRQCVLQAMSPARAARRCVGRCTATAWRGPGAPSHGWDRGACVITPPAAAGGECGATHKLAVVIQCVYVQDQYVLPDSHNTELVACEEASATRATLWSGIPAPHAYSGAVHTAQTHLVELLVLKVQNEHDVVGLVTAADVLAVPIAETRDVRNRSASEPRSIALKRCGSGSNTQLRESW